MFFTFSPIFFCCVLFFFLLLFVLLLTLYVTALRSFELLVSFLSLWLPDNKALLHRFPLF